VVAYCSPDADQAADALDRGVDIVIPSPCSLALLVRRLRSALRWAAR
jgi:DNA-binding response OmpR family regulator